MLFTNEINSFYRLINLNRMIISYAICVNLVTTLTCISVRPQTTRSPFCLVNKMDVET